MRGNVKWSALPNVGGAVCPACNVPSLLMSLCVCVSLYSFRKPCQPTTIFQSGHVSPLLDAILHVIIIIIIKLLDLGYSLSSLCPSLPLSKEVSVCECVFVCWFASLLCEQNKKRVMNRESGHITNDKKAACFSTARKVRDVSLSFFARLTASK